jgi:hypothetical protein
MLRVGLGFTDPNAAKSNNKQCCLFKGNGTTSDGQQQMLLEQKIGQSSSELDVEPPSLGKTEEKSHRDTFTSTTNQTFKGKSTRQVALKDGVAGKGSCSSADAKNQSINYVI